MERTIKNIGADTLKLAINLIKVSDEPLFSASF